MREIKFRAWDEQAKIMHHNLQFIKSGDLNIGGSDWIIPLEPITNEGWMERLTEHCKEAPHFRDQLKLMQYTGLKDKNGKEIYEGCILRLIRGGGVHAYDMSDPDADARVVQWDEETAGFTLYMVDMRKQGSGLIFCKGNANRGCFEIIGNIYENPELLEASHDQP